MLIFSVRGFLIGIEERKPLIAPKHVTFFKLQDGLTISSILHVLFRSHRVLILLTLPLKWGKDSGYVSTNDKENVMM